jgi:hypothetical protein
MINAPHSCGSSPSLRQLTQFNAPAIMVIIARGIESKIRIENDMMCARGLCTYQAALLTDWLMFGKLLLQSSRRK